MCCGECVLELRSLWPLRLVTGHAASLAHRQCLLLRKECALMSLQFTKAAHLGQLWKVTGKPFRFCQILFIHFSYTTRVKIVPQGLNLCLFVYVACKYIMVV